MGSTEFSRVLRALLDAEVEFIVVGGVAAVLQGAPITTLDLDIVHRRTPENLERLAGALSALGAVYRTRPGLEIAPDPSLLDSPGHHLLRSGAGPIDVLGQLVGRLGYEELRPDVRTVTLEGREVLVQGLASLIAVKEELGGAKDVAMLPVLRSTLEEIERRGG